MAATDELPHRIDPRFKDAESVTDLMRWSWEGVPEAVNHLIALGADVNAKDRDGRTPLFYVANGSGNVNVAKALLSAEANPNARDDEGYTALMLAVRRREGEPMGKLVQTLIESGADVNACTDFGYTVLMLAARDSTLEVAHLLIAAGADPKAKSHEGHSISQFASSDGRSSIARHFRKLESIGEHTLKVTERSGDKSDLNR